MQNFFIVIAFFGMVPSLACGQTSDLLIARKANPLLLEIDFRVHHTLERNNLFWNTKVDDYVQFAPAIAAYTMKICKVESSNNVLNMTIMYGISNLLAGSITSVTKKAVGRERPDLSNHLSFPSGHTQTAFVAAEFLHQEFKNESVWISVGGYAAASFVGIARIFNNKHWVSDVVVGAGIGILTTKVVYWVYPRIKQSQRSKERSSFALIIPEYSNGYVGVTFSARL
ncbi:MAG: phosphatase PAP2 family protein [Prevotellaceae bacterium]|jgi:hypothetical protein|nr:phosphatase PAP2 family protein [Prevotellaceae bacterium]